MGFWRHILARDQSLGAKGERLAARFLRKHGYRILERNVEVHDDEADLIALDPDGATVVVVEVKTRKDDGIAPEASVNSVKQRNLKRLAMKLQRHGRYSDRPMRFDVVAIVMPDRGKPLIRHIVGAFGA